MSVLSNETLPSSEVLETATEEGASLGPDLAQTWESKQKNLAFWLDIVVKIALIIAFVVGYLEYRENLRNQAVKAAYDLVNNWETGGYRSSLEEVAHQVQTKTTIFKKTYPDQVDNDILARSFVSQELIELAKTKRSFDRTIRHVFYFFGKAGVCVQKNICDADLVTGFFRDSGEDFLYYLGPYALKKRAEGQPEFGRLAESFVRRSGS